MTKANAFEIEIAGGKLADPTQNTVILKRVNKDTALWFTNDKVGNKFVQYWIAFDSDPFSEHVMATVPGNGKTATFHARDDGPLVAGQYTIYTADPTILTKGRRKRLTAGGGGIIIDN